MIEVAVETDDVHAVIGEVHFPVGGDKQRTNELREFRRQRVQLVLGDAHITDGIILRQRSERVLSFRDIANGEYADAVNFRWLKSAIAVSKDPFEALFA